MDDVERGDVMPQSLSLDQGRVAPQYRQRVPTSIDGIRLTLTALVRAAMTGQLPADGGFARMPLHRAIASYADEYRKTQLAAEHMLIDLKRVIEEATRDLPHSDRRQMTDDLIGWAIEAYYAEPG